MKFKIVFIILLPFLISSCTTNSEDIKAVRYYADTFVEGYSLKDGEIINSYLFGTNMFFVAYNNKDVEDLKDFFNNELKKYHKLFDNKYYYKDSDGNFINNLKVLNDSYGTDEEILLDEALYELIYTSYLYTKQSKGNFNLFVGELSSLWESAILNNEVPSTEQINSKLECIPSYSELENILLFDEENKSIQINNYNNCDKLTINLSAVAKSYALDLIIKNQIFENRNILISGGNSTIIGLGSNPLRETWNILIEQSVLFENEKKEAFQISLEGNFFLSTSGVERNYFKDEENNLYHHIINPLNGYPSNNYYSITTLSNSAVYSDFLTTSLFSMDFIDIEIFLLEENNISLLFQKEVDANLIVFINENMENLEGESFDIEKRSLEDEFRS